jgi:hypothetical protein
VAAVQVSAEDLLGYQAVYERTVDMQQAGRAAYVRGLIERQN